MKLRKFIYILTVFVVISVLLCNTLVSSALTTYNFVVSRPQITNNSCYFEIVDSMGTASLFYVSVAVDLIGIDNTYDMEKVSVIFKTYIKDGNLWVYPHKITPLDEAVDLVVESYTIYGTIIDNTGRFRNGTITRIDAATESGDCAGMYITSNYKCLRAYNAQCVSNGSDCVFVYGNEINTNNKLDSIYSAISGGNQEIIDNQNENADKVIQNQEENQEEIKNGWQQEDDIDTSTTDDYGAKDKELQASTDSGRNQTVSVFNNFGSLFTGDGHLYKGLLSVSAIFTEFFKIEWLSSLINFSLALGVFAFVIGTGSAVFKSAHEKHEYRKELKYMASENSQARREMND